MKSINNRVLLLMSCFFLFFLLSCKSNKEREEPINNDSIVIVEELPFLKDYDVYTFKYKDEIMLDANKELKKFDQKIEELKDLLKLYKDKTDDDAVGSYDDFIVEIENSREGYKNSVEALKKSTSEDWDNLKTDVANAYNTLLQYIENLKEQINLVDEIENIENDSIAISEKE